MSQENERTKVYMIPIGVDVCDNDRGPGVRVLGARWPTLAQIGLAINDGRIRQAAEDRNAVELLANSICEETEAK